MIDVTDLRVTADDVGAFCRSDRIDVGPVRRVRVMEDPAVSGTWAARVDVDAGEDGPGHVDLLFITRAFGTDAGTVPDLLDETCEEVEFTAWPPKSGALQFFL